MPKVLNTCEDLGWNVIKLDIKWRLKMWTGWYYLQKAAWNQGNCTGLSLQIFLIPMLFLGEDVACHSFSCHGWVSLLVALGVELGREVIQLCYFRRHKSGRWGSASACLSETLKLLLTNVHPFPSLKQDLWQAPGNDHCIKHSILI